MFLPEIHFLFLPEIHYIFSTSDILPKKRLVALLVQESPKLKKWQIKND